jgi:hypothetical protein
MAVIDSRNSGILPALTETNAELQLDAIRTLISTLTGLDLKNVRRRNLQRPGSRPCIDDDWAAVGVERIETLGTPDQINRRGDLSEPESGDVVRISHQNLHMIVTFYGPSAALNADRVREGIQLGQTNTWLHTKGMAFKSIDGDVMHLPDIVAEQWVDRYDLRFILGRDVRRTYGVRDLCAIGPIEIITDSHSEN